MEMKHFGHKHSLILNEVYIAKEGDECLLCHEQIVSCKSFVYSCSRVTGSSSTSTSNVDDRCVKFLLHKSCAELSPTIQNPSNKKQSLSFRPDLYHLTCTVCGICRSFVYVSDHFEFIVCFECAVFQYQSLEDRKFHHPAHSQHTFLLVQHPSSIRCYACKMESDIKDLSYICTECPFGMHKSCADAPASFTFPFHDKHPLILSFHLPQVYQKFDQHCKLCRKRLFRSVWLYYCPKCRFFAHFHCARSSHMVTSSSEVETYPDLVHLPPADSSATNVLVEQFVKAMSTLNLNIIFDETSTIKHRADCKHHLQLITYNELNDQKDDDNDNILLCDCCVKPIPTDGNQFYGCVSCKYFLHRDCAKLPNEIEDYFGPGLTVSADKYSEPFMFFYCYGCRGPGNGIFFRLRGYNTSIKYHIGCTVLPEKIKHEAHIHQLDRVLTDGRDCDACGRRTYLSHRCVTCDVYICAGCLMRRSTDKHPWDRHPLHLIYEAEMVTDDHEHDFDCEFCSKEIDTNYWFYHCSVCDFHLDCFGKSCYRHYSNVKFGATDIIVDKLHPHGPTLILNKKVRSCELCGAKQLGEPVLECTPCKVIFCGRCSKQDSEEESEEDSEEESEED